MLSELQKCNLLRRPTSIFSSRRNRYSTKKLRKCVSGTISCTTARETAPNTAPQHGILDINSRWAMSSPRSLGRLIDQVGGLRVQYRLATGNRTMSSQYSAWVLQSWWLLCVGSVSKGFTLLYASHIASIAVAIIVRKSLYYSTFN
jgi:hypothetical protein